MTISTTILPVLLLTTCLPSLAAQSPKASTGELRLAWSGNILTISAPRLPGGRLRVWYLEAYCRPGSTDRDWKQTVIGHRTSLVDSDPDGRWLKLRCHLKDGVIVDHTIYAEEEAIAFRLTAHNPTNTESTAHWAQPCIRVDCFTKCDQQDYLSKSFVFLDGQPERMPTRKWATQARYVPGQVWCPANVDRNDVNPRPLNTLVPSNGLIGCYSGDENFVMATAWEPYQELFQGVIVCLHSDFHIGGLAPNESKDIRGKIYIMPADIDRLLARYHTDFPEHAETSLDKDPGTVPES